MIDEIIPFDFSASITSISFSGFTVIIIVPLLRVVNGSKPKRRHIFSAPMESGIFFLSI